MRFDAVATSSTSVVGCLKSAYVSCQCHLGGGLHGGESGHDFVMSVSAYQLQGVRQFVFQVIQREKCVTARVGNTAVLPPFAGLG